MPLQSAQISLSNGQQTGTVTFPTPFAFTPVPPLIIPVVQNFSADPTILQLWVTVTACDANGFDFRLSAPTNTANYNLIYQAGLPDALYVATQGRRLTDETVFSGTLAAGDLIPMVQMAPIPQSFAMPISALQAAFPSNLAAAPSTPASTTGQVHSFLADDNYLYARTPSGVGRIGLSRTQWSLSDLALKTDRGSHLCTAVITQTITFAATFPVIPHVQFVIRNTVAGDKLLLTGNITARSTTTATITLNAVPTNGTDYYIDWKAESAQV